jgi:hypothetical protein
LRAGIPSPWRANALRSDGQVVPSGIHAAELLGRREAAFGLGAVPRNRLGCQPNPWRGHTAAAPMDRLLDTEA